MGCDKLGFAVDPACRNLVKMGRIGLARQSLIVMFAIMPYKGRSFLYVSSTGSKIQALFKEVCWKGVVPYNHKLRIIY